MGHVHILLDEMGLDDMGLDEMARHQTAYMYLYLYVQAQTENCLPPDRLQRILQLSALSIIHEQ